MVHDWGHCRSTVRAWEGTDGRDVTAVTASTMGMGEGEGEGEASEASVTTGRGSVGNSS